MRHLLAVQSTPGHGGEVPLQLAAVQNQTFLSGFDPSSLSSANPAIWKGKQEGDRRHQGKWEIKDASSALQGMRIIEDRP